MQISLARVWFSQVFPIYLHLSLIYAQKIAPIHKLKHVKAKKQLFCCIVMLHLLFSCLYVSIFALKHDFILDERNENTISNKIIQSHFLNRTLERIKSTCDALSQVNSSNLQIIFQNKKFESIAQLTLLLNYLCSKYVFIHVLFLFIYF